MIWAFTKARVGYIKLASMSILNLRLRAQCLSVYTSLNRAVNGNFFFVNARKQLGIQDFFFNRA